MDWNNVFEVLLPSVLTGVGGWFAGRRRNNADTKRVEIDNAERLSEVWQKNAESLEKQMADLMIVVDALRKENLSLKEMVYNLQTEVSEFKAQNNKLTIKLNEVKKYAENNRNTGNSTIM